MVNAFKRFSKNRSGNVVIIFALLLPVLLLVIGGSVEFGQNGNAQAKMQNIANSASLAGMSPKDITDEERTELAQKYVNAAYAKGEFNENFDLAHDVTITSSATQVTVEINGKTPPMFAFLGRDAIPVAIKSTAIPAEQTVPAAVDVVVGMDGGCGNEDGNGAKILAQVNATQTFLNRLRSYQNGRNLVYASGMWGGATAEGENQSHDYPTLTESLEAVSNTIWRLGDSSHVHGGTLMENVLDEMIQSINTSHAETRPEKLVEKRYRIGVVFQGSHQEKDVHESTTNNTCLSWMQQNFDGIYVVMVKGSQNDNNHCTIKTGSHSEQRYFPVDSISHNISNCRKTLPGITYPIEQRIDTGYLNNSLDTLAQQISNLKVTIPGGARITE